MSLTKVTYSMISGAQINVLDYGADPTGVDASTTAFEAAYADAVAGGGEVFIPAGTYKVKVTFNGEAPVRGAGIRRTILVPSDTASYCVRLYGTGVDANLGATLTNCSIVSTAGTGTGLLCGDSSGTGFSNGLVERLEISGFADNWLINQAIVCSFKHIYSTGGTYGLRIDSENNVTTCSFESCRMRLNDYGIKMEAGLLLDFTNCNSESNVYKNLWLRSSVTQGPSRWTFNGCWFENVTGGSGDRYSVHLDMQAAVATTKQTAILFNRCGCFATGFPDVHVDRAQDVVFDRCAFTAFDATQFTYATGTGAVRVLLRDCGTLQLAPTEALYASFPALTYSAGGAFGFRYEFTDVSCKRHTNYEVISTAASLTSRQVAYATTIVVDTSSGSLDINSFVGGSDGQVLRIIKAETANNLVIKHNATGTEKIFTATASDLTLTGREGVTLVCSGSTWYEAQYV